MNGPAWQCKPGRRVIFSLVPPKEKAYNSFRPSLLHCAAAGNGHHQQWQHSPPPCRRPRDIKPCRLRRRIAIHASRQPRIKVASVKATSVKTILPDDAAGHDGGSVVGSTGIPADACNRIIFIPQRFTNFQPFILHTPNKNGPACMNRRGRRTIFPSCHQKKGYALKHTSLSI